MRGRCRARLLKDPQAHTWVAPVMAPPPWATGKAPPPSTRPDAQLQQAPTGHLGDGFAAELQGSPDRERVGGGVPSQHPLHGVPTGSKSVTPAPRQYHSCVHTARLHLIPSGVFKGTWGRHTPSVRTPQEPHRRTRTAIPGPALEECKTRVHQDAVERSPKTARAGNAGPWDREISGWGTGRSPGGGHTADDTTPLQPAAPARHKGHDSLQLAVGCLALWGSAAHTATWGSGHIPGPQECSMWPAPWGLWSTAGPREEEWAEGAGVW